MSSMENPFQFSSKQPINTVYKFIKQIGSGSYGDVFLGECIGTGEKVAIKIESTHNHKMLRNEVNVYRELSNEVGFPKILQYGPSNETKMFHALVMDVLGPTLRALFDYCQQHFSLKTILMLTDQMITRLECLHSKGFVHRDLKPSNFLMGKECNSSQLFLIDFGLAKVFDQQPPNHNRTSRRKSFTGTARYASINACLGREQSPRDDMESLGYVIMYFNRGKLPWQNLEATNGRQKVEKMAEMKMSTLGNELCRGFPQQFSAYFVYCRNLRFDEKPDYNILRQLFRNLYKSLKFENDRNFGWAKMDPTDSNEKQKTNSDSDKEKGQHNMQSFNDPKHANPAILPKPLMPHNVRVNGKKN